MSQAHLIAKSFKDIVAGDEELNAALPGNVHYGDRLRPEIGFGRAYALITVKQGGSENMSGGQKLVEYTAQLKVYGGQEVGDVGEIQDLLDAKFNALTSLPSVTGRLIGLVTDEGFLTEDDEEDQDQDVMICTLAWKITILESWSLTNDSNSLSLAGS